MVYRLADGHERWPADKRRGVVEAMDAAIALYNRLGDFPKNVIAAYNPGIPTADGNYNGNIRFGGQIGKRVALHELGHVLGVGQHPRWNSLIKEGRWTGPHAIAQLRAFDGPDAVLYADRQHFWPYGLNFDKESSPENDRRHVLMVAAFRRDLGIESGRTSRGRNVTPMEPKFLEWAETPPMGWNSWDAFATTVTEAQTRAQADYMAEKLARYAGNTSWWTSSGTNPTRPDSSIEKTPPW